jgi:hypothetical protein
MTGLTRKAAVATLLLLALFGVPQIAHAEDGGSGGGGSGGSSGSGGNSGSGSSGGNSGSDGEDQHDGDSRRRRDSDDALAAVKSGSAVSLKKLKVHINLHYPGRILKVELRKLTDGYVYRFKVLQTGNKVTTLSIDAMTLARK